MGEENRIDFEMSDKMKGKSVCIDNRFVVSHASICTPCSAELRLNLCRSYGNYYPSQSLVSASISRGFTGVMRIIRQTRHHVQWRSCTLEEKTEKATWSVFSVHSISSSVFFLSLVWRFLKWGHVDKRSCTSWPKSDKRSCLGQPWVKVSSNQFRLARLTLLRSLNPAFALLLTSIIWSHDHTGFEEVFELFNVRFIMILTRTLDMLLTAP